MRPIFKTSMICLAALFVLSAAVPAGAVVKFELAGGADFPTGEFNDYWTIGFGGSGTILFELTPFTSVGVNLGYNAIGLDEDDLRAGFSIPESVEFSGGDASIFNVCGELRFHTGAMDKATFSGGVGLGLYNVGISDFEVSEGGLTETLSYDRENQLGGYFHAGFAMSMSPAVQIGLKGQMTFFKIEKISEDFEIGETRSFLSVMAVIMVGI